MQRESNFELCRIVAILLVVVYHSTFNSFGFPVYSSDCRPGIIALASLSVIGVNVFVLLTGYFSVRPKKKSIMNLLFICLFYAVVRIVYEAVAYGHFAPVNLLFVSNSNWFIPIYMGLLIFAPLLNDFVEKCTKKQLGMFVLLLFVYETWFGFCPGVQHGYGFANGYSVISFVLLYFIGRYIRIYGHRGRSKLIPLASYLIMSICFGVTFYFAIASGMKMDKMAGYMCGYNNPLIVFAAVSFFLIFEDIRIPEKIGRCVNHIAKSCLAVLLLHSSPAIFPSFQNLFVRIDTIDSCLGKASVWALAVLAIFFVCVIVDQLRQASFKVLTGKILDKYESR